MLRIFLLLFLFPVVTGCTPNYTILEHRDLNMTATGDRPTIVIEMMHGPITVTTANGKEISGQLTVRGVGVDKEEAEKEIKAIDFDIKPDVDGKILIKATRTDGSKHWNNSGTEATLQVPASSKLELITANSSILVTGRNQGVIAKTTNGSVSIKQSASSVYVQSSNGAVTCNDVVGPANIETSNAAITLTGKQMLLNCKSSNGSIKFAGDLIPGNHKLQTSNSHINVTLPQNACMSLSASTSNGRITNDFKLTKVGSKNSKTNLEGEIGEGDASNTNLTLKTSNSSIAIKRSKNNKQLEIDTE